VNERLLAATVIVQATAGAAVWLVANHLRSGAPAPARVVMQARPRIRPFEGDHGKRLTALTSYTSRHASCVRQSSARTDRL
jgi:hypothetical protein